LVNYVIFGMMFNNLQRYKKNDKHTPLENLSLEA